MEVLIVTQQEKWQFATCKKRSSDRIYVLTATNNDVNLVETRTVHFMTINSPFRFYRIYKLDGDHSYWQILALVCSLNS